MPLLNFKEISRANEANGNQDQFELFARDFFQTLGFEILSGPDRGQDGGRDLIIQEKREGSLGTNYIKWLVSCKHKAHSGRAVNDSDEVDITDRVNAHNAHGFIGFYSSITSSPFTRKLEQLKNKIEIIVYDNEKIEKILIDKNLKEIMSRYFPLSSHGIVNRKYNISNLLSKYEELNCEYCGKDLLDHSMKQQNLVAFISEDKTLEDGKVIEHIKDIYWSCKGNCDNQLERKYGRGGWEDIDDLLTPIKYISWIMSILNSFQSKNTTYSDEAFEKLKEFLIKISQLVFKNQSKEDIDRFIELKQFNMF